MMKKTKILLSAVLCLLCMLCQTAQAAEKMRIAVTFSVPADWVRQIGKDKVDVTSFVPENSDSHDYQPSPSDMKKLRDADLVFALSPQFEIWFAEMSADMRKKHPEKFIFLAADMFPKNSSEEKNFDPHVWTDPQLVAEKFVPTIAAALGVSGEKYATEIAEFQKESMEKLSAFPSSRRNIVTYHRNMSHFGKRFSVGIAGTILASSTTESADPSAKVLANLAKKIRENRLPVFIDNTVTSRIPYTLTREAGVHAPYVLRVDALDVPGSPAGTYLGMMRENVRELCQAFSEERTQAAQ